MALTHAHLEHHDDHERVEIARSGKEKLPEDVFLRHMREVCDDDEYWSSIYGSYDFSTGGRVLTGPGLDWSAPNDPRATPTGVDHVRDLKAACKKMETEVEHAGLYRVFWEGREAPRAQGTSKTNTAMPAGTRAIPRRSRGGTSSEV